MGSRQAKRREGGPLIDRQVFPSQISPEQHAKTFGPPPAGWNTSRSMRGAPPAFGGGPSGMPMPGGMPGMPGMPQMPGGLPGPTPGGIGKRLTNDPGGFPGMPGGRGGIKGIPGRVMGWAEENPEIAGGIAGAAASTYGAYKQGQAEDKRLRQEEEQREWERQQEEDRQRRKEEAMEEMQAQWKEWGWV